jgi:hypothetical protein
MFRALKNAGIARLLIGAIAGRVLGMRIPHPHRD